MCFCQAESLAEAVWQQSTQSPLLLSPPPLCPHPWPPRLIMHESQIGHIRLDAAPFAVGCGSTRQMYTLIAAVLGHELDLGV